MEQRQTGIFGKLPAHGDFVMRDLPSGFVSAWDEWLQHYVAGSKEKLEENWLNIYLTSPIWRFVFTDGVVDTDSWAGVMMPSVDRVGRYYPITTIKALPRDTNPLEFITHQVDWFSEIEELMLQSLDGEMDIDELSSRINSVNLNFDSIYVRNSDMCASHSGKQVSMEFEEQMPVSVYPSLFDSVLRELHPSYGVWSTTGSEQVEPCLFITQGLPNVGALAAMLDGKWQHWGWQQPYQLQELETEGQS